MQRKCYLASLIRNYSVLSQVALIPHQKLVHIFTGIPVNFIQPLLDIVKALLVSYIIHNLQKYNKVKKTQINQDEIIIDTKRKTKKEQRKRKLTIMP